MLTQTIGEQLLAQIMAGDMELCSIYADWLEDQGKEPEPFWRQSLSKKMLTFLTPSQTSYCSTWVKYWSRVGLTTGPCNRDRAEDCIRKAYKAEGRRGPTVVKWLLSPCKAIQEMSKSLRDCVAEENRIWNDDNLKAQVDDKVREEVWYKVSNQVWAKVWAKIWRKARDDTNTLVYPYTYSRVDTYWLSFYSFLLAVGRVNACHRFIPFVELAHLCSLCWRKGDTVVLTESPNQILKDEKGNPTKLIYVDGWEVEI